MALTQTQAPTGFNCVHLPIVYEYTSSLFPTNTVDTARTVNSFTNDSGYCRLTLSGDIKASGSANELEYVSVVVDGVTGIYQIYNYYSDTDITIDLEYDAGIIFGNVQYYYSNYHGRFKIYAGLRSGHTFSSSKPFRLITEIKAVPDSTGVIKLNINEILKSDIEILDGVNTNNDIGQFTEFYVNFAESYDQSVDGYTLSSYVSAYTDNSANYALAVNSKLPFKNGYGGEMTQYVGSSRKFLNLGNTYFPGNNFYITYLVEPPPNDSNSYAVGVKSYSNGSLIYTASVGVSSENEGVYNVLINSGVSATADEIEVYLTGESESKFITIDNTCSNQSLYLTWRNYLGGFDSWLFTAEKEYSIDIEEVKSAEKNIFIDWDSSYNSDRIKFNTLRTARESILVRSQNLTLDQLNFIKYIKTSPLVFSDRVVLVDEQSFMVYSETDKLYSISFSISYTDTIPSQSL